MILMEKSSQKIVITGGQGYVGSILMPYLSEHGYQVACYDTGFFKDCFFRVPPPEIVVRKDARDLGEKDFQGAAAVVHLAGISNDPVGTLSPAKVYDPTRHYAKAIAQICKRNGIKFIFASSCSIYGKATSDVVNENSVPAPQTGYSLNKLEIEQDLALLAGEGFSPIALRFATAYGYSPRLRLDLYINMMVAMAVAKKEVILNSDGQAWRPNVHVLDMCKAILCAIKSDKITNVLTVLNVGADEENYKILDVANAIVSRVEGAKLSFLNTKKNAAGDSDLELIRDRKVKHAAADTRSYKVDFSRVRNFLPEFKCEWTIQRGIDELIDVFQKTGFSQKEFADIKFYRLQKMEDLWKRGLISDDFRWVNY